MFETVRGGPKAWCDGVKCGRLSGSGKILATVYKHKQEDACVLVFPGSDATKDWVINLLGAGTGTWCSIEGLHEGFAHAMQAVGDGWQGADQALPYC